MVNCLRTLCALRINFGLTEGFLQCHQQGLAGQVLEVLSAIGKGALSRVILMMNAG